MAGSKQVHSRFWARAAAATLASYAILASAAGAVRAQSSGDSPRNRAVAANVTFTPPPDSSRPSRTTGGASRGDGCGASASQGLFAMLPDDGYGLTASGRPTLFAYVSDRYAREGALAIEAENGTSLYEATVALGDRPGVVAIALPEDAPELMPGRNYRWTLAVECTAAAPDSSSVVWGSASGWIHRIDTDPAQSAATPIERAARYGRAGVWYDALGELAALRQASPNDAESAIAWESLLESAGLDEVAAAAIAPARLTP